jgi:hypothetical protein
MARAFAFAELDGKLQQQTTAAERGLIAVIAERGPDVAAAGQFTEIALADTIQLIGDPVSVEHYLVTHHIHSEVIAELVGLSEVVRMLELGVLERWPHHNAAYDWLVDVEVAVDHLDAHYDDEGEYHIALLQHAAWFAFVCACSGFVGFNPFKEFRHR